MEFVKKYIGVALAFVLGFVAAYGVLTWNKKQNQTQEFKKVEEQVQQDVEEGKKEQKILKENNEKILAKTASSTDASAFDFVKVAEQKAGKNVDVAYVKADFPFWIVIHAEKDGKIWNALGARMKKAGDTQV